MSTKLDPKLSKLGKPPGTLIYTGTQYALEPTITLLEYSPSEVYTHQASNLKECTVKKLIIQ